MYIQEIGRIPALPKVLMQQQNLRYDCVITLAADRDHLVPWRNGARCFATYRANARSSPTMRDAKGFVQIQMETSAPISPGEQMPT